MNEFENVDGGWPVRDHNAPGFPRVFHIKYHGYSWHFPLLALARYRALPSKNRSTGRRDKSPYSI